MDLELITESTSTIATLAEFKADRGITWDTEDDRLQRVLLAASRKVEDDSGQYWTEWEWLQTHTSFYCGIQLMKTPAAEIEISYLDENGDLQTLEQETEDTWNWRIRHYPTPLVIFNDPPDTYTAHNAVQISITTGAENELAKQACLMLAGAWNENREAETTGSTPKEITFGYWNLIIGIRRSLI